MAQRFIQPKVSVCSTGIYGRHICSARTNHFVVDDSVEHDGPGEALTAGELFLAGIASCATLMMERIAKAKNLPLKRVEVESEARIDTEAKRQGPAVFDFARLKFTMAGVSEESARRMVETYKRT